MSIDRAAQLPERKISRRDVLRYGAVTGAVATVGPALPGMVSPAHAHGHPHVLPAPKPIPGGLTLPDGSVIHVFVPGPEDVTLPHSGITLMGLDVEPSVITDYKGATALAYHVGTARGSDGKRYNLETDLRALEGIYVGEDGRRHRGLFALI